MSEMTFEEFMSGGSGRGSGFNKEYDYFNLKSGETKTVRFMVESVADFDLEAVHEVKFNEERNGTVQEVTRKVPCLGKDCPLCKANVPIKKRIFIPMIEYSSDGSTHKFVAWDKAKDTAQQLANYLNDYGPLTDILCNITRTGKGLDTTYGISPNVKAMFRQNYPVEPFPDVKPSKYFVRNWSADDMNYFINTGEPPVHTPQNEDNSAEANAYYDSISEMNAMAEEPTPVNQPTFVQQFNQQQTSPNGRQRY